MFFVNCGVAKNKQPGRKACRHATSTMHMQSMNMKNIISGATQSVVDQLTNRALHDAKLREKDAETYVKKYMKVALFLFKEEIPHTTKFEKLLDLICSM